MVVAAVGGAMTEVHTVADADAMRVRIAANAVLTADWFAAHKRNPMELLRAMRFDLIGHDPLTGAPLNVVEQINQTFTILVTLRAVEELLIKLHPEIRSGYRLALGTSSGRDIESVEKDLVAAEVFSATRPTSNQKLKKDIARLLPDPARHRYVFFACPNFAVGRHPNLESDPGIQVYAVEP
jgi:hypothetical protein